MNTASQRKAGVTQCRKEASPALNLGLTSISSNDEIAARVLCRAASELSWFPQARILVRRTAVTQTKFSRH